MGPVVSPQCLAEHLGDEGVRVVDCRYVLGDAGAGRRLYLERHIAGAAFLSLDEDLADPVDDGRRGRHPLPSADRFEAAARSAGISNSSVVVAYDQGGTGGAARLWWLLRHFGHGDVAVLDGGFDGWDGPVATGREDVPAGDFTAAPRDGDVVDVDDVAARLQRPERVLVDARAAERYRGDVEPIDRVGGHIAGAVNAPYTEAVPDSLLETEQEVVVYCGSGVTACELLLKMAAAGRAHAKLYAGSYSEWVNRGLPIETGHPGSEVVEEHLR